MHERASATQRNKGRASKECFVGNQLCLKWSCIALGVAFLTPATRPVWADPVWTGSADSSFSNSANWSGGSPNASTVVEFVSTTQNQPVVSGVTASVQGIVFGPQAPGFTLALVNGGNTGQSLSIGTGGIQNQSSALQRLTANSLNSNIIIEGAGAQVSGHVEIDNLSLLSSTTFASGASAGSATIVNSGGGQTNFSQASAGNAQITVGASSGLSFTGASTADHAQIQNIAGGTISFNDTSSAANAVLLNQGRLAFAATSSAGSANLSNQGTILFGNTASAGAARINNEAGGVLQFADQSQAGTATIVNQAGGSISFTTSASAPSARIVNQAGASVDVSGVTSNQVVAIGSLSGGGSVQLGGTTLSVGGADQSDTLSGSISGPSGQLIKEGSGTLVLSGSSDFGGATRVASGVLQIDGSIVGNVEVDASATLTGLGHIGGGVNVAAGGLLVSSVPGSGLTIKGNVSFAPLSVLSTNFQPGGVAGELTSTGQVQLGGAILRITALGTQSAYTAGSTYTIINATGGIAGQFSTVQSNFTSLVPELRTLPSALEVVLESAAIAAPGVNPTSNQTGTASGLTGIAALVGPLTSIPKPALSGALTALSASPYSALRRLALEDNGAFAREIAQRGVLGSINDTLPGTALWIDLVGAGSHLEGDRNAAGYRTVAQGLIGGTELYRSSDMSIRVAGETVRTRVGYDDRQASAQSDAIRVALFLDKYWEPLHLSGTVSYGTDQDILNRSLSEAGLTSSAAARTGLAVWSGQIRADWPLGHAGDWIMPFGAFQWITSSGGAFDERGAGAADLIGGRDTLNLGITSLGITRVRNFSYAWTDMPAELNASVAWLHRVGAVVPTIQSHFVASPDSVDFNSVGPRIEPDTIQLSAGLHQPWSLRWSADARLSADFSHRYRAVLAYLGVRYVW